MFHTIIIVGNLGKDPEMRYTPSGKPVTSFSVATSHQYTNNNGETVKETAWFRVTTWGARAEVCNQYLHKGSKVLVEGRLTCDLATGGPRIWTGQDGLPRATFEVNASNVTFLSSQNSGSGSQHQSTQTDPEDDIPF
jgi:single-strand DNA-binding protein